MNEQAGSTRTTGPSAPTDPSIRRRRIDALLQAHHAREILDREGALDTRPLVEDRSGTVEGSTAARGAQLRDDLERLMEIHRSLQHERQVARRPFHRHSDRLVLALELAERLALDRLGYDDFADFESHHGDGRPGREIIDLDLIERAERDLADAEATLAELDRLEATSGPAVRRTTWTIDPVPHGTTDATLRVTTTRRLVFGTGPGRNQLSPGADALPMRRRAMPLPKRPVPARGPFPGEPLPFRRPQLRLVGDGPTAGEPRRDRSPEDPERGLDREVLDLDELVLAEIELHEQAGDGAVLGEIVHNGRRRRVDKIGGLVDADDGDDPSAGAITYGDPNRPD